MVAEVLPSPYSGELKLRHPEGPEVKIPVLNYLRRCIRDMDINNMDKRDPEESLGFLRIFGKQFSGPEGLRFYTDAGSLKALDEATRQLMLFDGYPHIQAGDLKPLMSPLPPFKDSIYDHDGLMKYREFFDQLIEVLREHPGDWLSSPAGWSNRIADRSSLEVIIERNIGVNPSTVSLVFEKVRYPSVPVGGTILFRYIGI